MRGAKHNQNTGSYLPLVVCAKQNVHFQKKYLKSNKELPRKGFYANLYTLRKKFVTSSNLEAIEDLVTKFTGFGQPNEARILSVALACQNFFYSFWVSYFFTIYIGPCTRADWLKKPMFYNSVKHKSVFYFTFLSYSHMPVEFYHSAILG